MQEKISSGKKLKVLGVYPEFKLGFWNMKKPLAVMGKKATMPPNGLPLVLKMMSDSPYSDRFDFEQIVDMNVESLSPDKLKGVDLVVTSAMVPQQRSHQQVIDMVSGMENGPAILAGGPLPTSFSKRVPGVDYIVSGEAEITLGPFLDDLMTGTANRIYTEGECLDRINVDLTKELKPSIEGIPIPRWDLVDMSKYFSIGIQYSRGCPHHCEFCDIPVLYGHTPRTKTPDQMVGEVQAIYDAGFRGELFIVDDNFIGNKRNAMEFLPELIKWQKEHGYPFNWFTEASMNLAWPGNKDLREAMVESGCNSVFLGIETPDPDVASAMNKGQNTKMDPLEACKVIKKSGMGITAGFMLGVDGEKKTIFNQMYELIEDAGIPDPMVGLVAIGEGSDGVGTALYERLRREGRLKVKEETDGTNTHNFYLDFIPNGEMDEAEIVNGYKDLLGRLFLDEGNYYQRCKNNHDLITPNPHVGKSGFSLEKLATMGRFMKCLAPKWLGGDGAANSKSMEYLSWVIRNHRDQFPEAAAQVVRHQHFKDVTTAALDADAYAPKVESLYSQLVGKAGKIYDNCKDKGQEAIDRAKIKMAGIAEKVVRSAEKKYHKLHDSFREGAALNALINLRERIAGKEYLPAFAIAG